MSILSIFRSNIFRGSKTVPVGAHRDAPAKPTVVNESKTFPVAPSVDTTAIIAAAQATAQAQAREIIISAKDEAFKVKDQAIKDARIQLEEIEVRSRNLVQKQQSVTNLEEQLKKDRATVEATQKQADDMKTKIQEQSDSMVEKLEKIASLTTEQAKKEILTQIEKRSAGEIARIVKEAEEKGDRGLLGKLNIEFAEISRLRVKLEKGI